MAGGWDRVFVTVVTVATAWSRRVRLYATVT